MELLETLIYLAAALVVKWDVFAALFMFTLLVIAVRLIGKVRAGERVAKQDFEPNSELIYSVSNNIALALVNALVWSAMLVGLYALIDAFWTETLGVDRWSVGQDWPFWLQLCFVLILKDFGNYWSHRLLHRPWMWHIHSLHHSDRYMNATTAVRIHVLEAVQMSLVALVILGWMNMPIVAVGVAGVLRTWYSFYIHSRLPFDHGRLRKVFASPNYHRWHHADDPAVYGKNLCDMFPIWDIAFGTHYDPGRCDIPQGVGDAPDDVVRGQLHPFIRWGAGIWNAVGSVSRSARPEADQGAKLR